VSLNTQRSRQRQQIARTRVAALLGHIQFDDARCTTLQARGHGVET
jgi:hypothetical protein